MGVYHNINRIVWDKDDTFTSTVRIACDGGRVVDYRFSMFDRSASALRHRREQFIRSGLRQQRQRIFVAGGSAKINSITGDSTSGYTFADLSSQLDKFGTVTINTVNITGNTG